MLGSLSTLSTHVMGKHYEKEANEALQQVLSHGAFWEGPELKAFEKEFAAYLGVGECVGVGSGTSALELSLEALELPPKSIVVTQTNTFAATAMAIERNGHIPLFIDCDEEGMMDLDGLDRTLEMRDVKVVILVHLFGTCPDMDRVMKIVEKHDVVLIEDCAQAHGTMFKGRKVGSFGTLSCFSFFPGKNLGCLGDGGAVCGSDKVLMDRVLYLTQYGARVKYHHFTVGTNSRLDSFQAAFLSKRLVNLDSENESRRKLASLYRKHLDPSIKLMHREREQVFHVYYLFIIMLDPRIRNKIKKELEERGIYCSVQYPIPCHKLEAFSHLHSKSLKVGESLASSILSLPLHPWLSENQVVYISSQVNQLIELETIIS